MEQTVRNVDTNNSNLECSREFRESSSGLVLPEEKRALTERSMGTFTLPTPPAWESADLVSRPAV